MIAREAENAHCHLFVRLVQPAGPWPQTISIRNASTVSNTIDATESSSYDKADTVCDEVKNSGLVSELGQVLNLPIRVISQRKSRNQNTISQAESMLTSPD